MSKKTEDVNPRFSDLDLWSTRDAVEAMHEGQLVATAATRNALPAIADAADQAAARIGDKGRLIYVGAGTSGRLAVLDGVELGPTFGWPSERLVYCLAGGDSALVLSAEGAEDDELDAANQIQEHNVTASDIVIGVAASGKTPFTVAAIKEAKKNGALTIGIANNANTSLLEEAEYSILAETGAEIIAGSTRMKAGTSQKMTLNMLSTAIMLRLNRVYKGYMVDMVISNVKLEKRAINMVAEIAEVGTDIAANALKASNNSIKTAILLSLGMDQKEIEALLQTHKGSLRASIEACKDA